MKKYVFIIMCLLLIGCGNKERYELTFDMAMNCYKLVYQFEDGTRVYSSYSDIKYKTDSMEISINEAIEKKYIKLSDIENNDNFKIVKDENQNFSCIAF